MKQVAATVTFRTKVRSEMAPYIEYKRTVSRRDCNLKPHQHDYYNSDMFPSMLQRAYIQALSGRTWCRLSELPETVTVDASGFLATVTVRIIV